MQPFIFINDNNTNYTNIFNLLLAKYKEIYSKTCNFRKKEKEYALYLRIKYNIENKYAIFHFKKEEYKLNNDNSPSSALFTGLSNFPEYGYSFF